MDHSLINTALGREKGSLLLKGGHIANVFNGKIEKKDVLIKNGTVAACGSFSEDDAEEVMDVTGRFLLPGFIDAHIHIESSHMTPYAFGRAMIKKGTCAVIADPHEIANVVGADGLDFMMKDAENSPVDIFFMLPSAVPATDKETAGAEIDAETVKELFQKYPQLLGLGELMNVPGILFGDGEVSAKIDGAEGRILDGHCPLLGGRELAAYAAAGINSDHECISVAEAEEKLANGITVFMREGSSAKNLDDLLPLVNDGNYHRICFCADDICASDIDAHGDILHCLRKAVAAGIDPVRAVTMATVNAANHYRLPHRGAIAPGYLADIVAVKDMESFAVVDVIKNGVVYTETKDTPKKETFGTFTLKNKDIAFPKPEKDDTVARVIGVSSGQIVTDAVDIPIAELEQHDIARLYVLERYGKNGNIGYALAEGFGLKKGALASSVAHDSHNLLILASDDTEAAFAAEVMEKMGGGMCVVCEGEVKAAMELPVGGLMCNEDAAMIAEKEKSLAIAAKELGITQESPFMTLSFMALPVIPKRKITDQGLFDVEKFDFISLYD